MRVLVSCRGLESSCHGREENPDKMRVECRDNSRLCVCGSLDPAWPVRPSALSDPGNLCSAPGARSRAQRHGEPACVHGARPSSVSMGFPTDTGRSQRNVTVCSYATTSFLPAPGAFQAATSVRPCCHSDKTRSPGHVLWGCSFWRWWSHRPWGV